MDQKFCPKCGSTKGPFIKGFCRDCFLREHALFEIPAKIKIERCKACGKIRAFGKWLPQENSLLEKIIGKQAIDLKNPVFSFSFFPQGQKIIAKVKLQGKIDSAEVEQGKETVLEFLDARCDSCMKSVSNYFEATIQLRFEKKSLEEKVLEEIEKMLQGFSKEDLLAKIVSLKKQKKGIDLVFGSNKSASKIAKAVAKKYKAKLVVSFKQAKGGTIEKAKKRFTYCIRIN